MNQDETERHISSVPWAWRDVLLGILAAGTGILVLNGILVGVSLLTRSPLRESGDVISVFIVAQGVVLLGTVWAFGVRQYHVGWAQVGLKGFSARVGCVWAAALLIASYFLRAVYITVAALFGAKFGVQPIMTRLDTAGVGFVLTLVVGAVVAPLAEEVFFRGFVYGGLRARLGVPAAIGVTSLFFAALHMSLEFFVPILILGIFLALLYEMTNSLYPGMMLHVSNNLVALIVFFAVRSMGIPLPT